MLPKVGGIRRRMTLDQYLWKGKDHLTLGELAERFSRYLYLPRVKDRDTLVDAVRDGAMSMMPGDTFATAEAFDEAGGPASPQPAPPAALQKPRAFVGSVKLNGMRVGESAGRIGDEVLAHLAALPGAKVDVRGGRA